MTDNTTPYCYLPPPSFSASSQWPSWPLSSSPLWRGEVFDRAFGRSLQEFRKARDVSQEKLALDAGLDRTFVSLLERGLRSPTMRTLIALAAELDVRPSEIVQRMEELLPKWRRSARS
jgi:DNA-binding XRE family transcriptional regulator